MTAEAPLRIKEIVDKTTVFFKQKNFSSPRLDAELLISDVLKIKRIDLYLKFDQPLSEGEVSLCREVVRRRANGEPVAYILNKRDFYGFSFYVDPHVLIPRPETEHLVEEILLYLNDKEDSRILDLGTGSGCIAISVLKNKPRAQATMVDVSVGAIEVARRNATDLAVLERCEFKHWNATETLQAESEGYDVIVANPPYIAPHDPLLEENVKKFEPAQALFAEDEGLRFISQWSKSQAPHLKPGGMMIFEIGASQGPSAKDIFSKLQIFRHPKKQAV